MSQPTNPLSHGISADSLGLLGSESNGSRQQGRQHGSSSQRVALIGWDRAVAGIGLVLAAFRMVVVRRVYLKYFRYVGIRS